MEPRLDVATNALTAVGKHLVAANAAVNDVVPTLTRELVKIRASQINGCTYCLDLHTTEAATAGETPARLHLVAAWRDATVFDDAERAALELAEQGTRIAGGRGVTDDAWDHATKHYDTDQLVALVAQIALINAFNRLCVITRQPDGAR